MRGQTRTIYPFNEDWTFVPYEIDPAQVPEDLPEAENVTLPHTWNAVDGTDGGADYRRGTSTYVKRFHRRSSARKQWLEFRGVNSKAAVFLNGVLLARHHGGYSTFRVRLPDEIVEANCLVVLVDNGIDDSTYPQRADFTFYGGIYRDVYLIDVSEEHFSLEREGGPGVVVRTALDGPDAFIDVEAAVEGGDYVAFSIPGVGTAEAPVMGGRARGRIHIPEVRRWHGLVDPHLYTLEATLLSAGTVVDEVVLRFGCREFEVDAQRGFLLNGEPYALRGVSRHQDWEGVGNAISKSMMATDLALLLELGATTVRLAHYQHDQEFLDLCDEAGIVVWAEIPMLSDFLPNAVENAKAQLTELIVQNRHHPSVICWGLSNEITITGNSAAVLDAHRELNQLAHQLDPERLTAMAHLFVLDPSDPLVRVPDVSGYNIYYGWYVGELTDNEGWLDAFHEQYPELPLAISEYGADANPAFQSSEPRKGDYSEQFQARYHEHLLEVISERSWLWATYVWNFADFGVDGRDEGGIAGRNQKGLVTFDRSVRKDAFYLYKAAWSSEPFVHICGRRYKDRAEALTEVTVYSNADEVSLWKDDQFIGQATGKRVFRFEVPISGEHQITVRSGDLTDSIVVRRVDSPNPGYAMDVATVSNWFDATTLPAPEGFYSIRDTMAEIRRSPDGAELIDGLLAALSGKRANHVAEDVMKTEVAQYVISRMTIESLLRQAGDAVHEDQISGLNASLNRIPRA